MNSRPGAFSGRTLSNKSSSEFAPTDTFAVTRLRTGEEALRMVTAADGHLFTNDGPENEQEADLIGRFFEDLADCCDIWSHLSHPDRLSAQLSARRQYEQLLASGFVAYGSSRRERMRFGNTVNNHLICYINLYRRSNPLLRPKAPELEALFAPEAVDDDLTTFVLCARKP